MENIWIYLILIGALALFSKSKKRKAASTQRRPVPELEEPWIDIDLPMETGEPSTPSSVFAPSSANRTPQATSVHRPQSTASPYVVHRSTQQSSATKSKQDDNTAPILDPNNPQDVRRAFILSEIFNRKY